MSPKQTIDRGSAVPLYKQIKQILIEELQANQGKVGKPFSTEEELVRRFHVSRAPVRQALKELAQEGYVYRERAKGTFPVQQLPVRPPSLELGGIVNYLREQGLDCRSRVLEVGQVPVTDILKEALRLEDVQQVLKISRLIFVSKQPLILTTTYLHAPENFTPTIIELQKGESVFKLLEQQQGVFISRGDHQLWAGSATREEAKRLKINLGDPILIMETKLYTKNDQLIGWRRAIHRAEDYKVSFSVNR